MPPGSLIVVILLTKRGTCFMIPPHVPQPARHPLFKRNKSSKFVRVLVGLRLAGEELYARSSYQFDPLQPPI